MRVSVRGFGGSWRVSKMRVRAVSTFILVVGFLMPALANDIYITQVGDTLDLDIVQDGRGMSLETQQLQWH